MQIAFFMHTGILTVLKSYCNLLPYTENINFVKCYVEVINGEAYNEVTVQYRVIVAMKPRGAKTLTVVVALIT